MRIAALCVALLCSATAFAEETCSVEVGPNDVLKKSGDVIIEAGQVVEDAYALDGRVIVRKGAKATNVISLHGDVVIEDGATVAKTALAIGGTVTAAPGSVKSIIEVSKKGLRLRGEKGDEIDLNFKIDGKSLGQRIADEALARVKNCTVIPKT